MLGTHADGVWPISDTEVMALAKKSDERLSADKAADEYWSQPCAAFKVDPEDGTHEPYKGMPDMPQMQSANQHVVDGVSYYQNYKHDDNDAIEVVELGALTTDGWKKQFESNGGDLWIIGRVR